jgi:hypothetical protein
MDKDTLKNYQTKFNSDWHIIHVQNLPRKLFFVKFLELDDIAKTVVTFNSCGSIRIPAPTHDCFYKHDRTLCKDKPLTLKNTANMFQDPANCLKSNIYLKNIKTNEISLYPHIAVNIRGIQNDIFATMG